MFFRSVVLSASILLVAAVAPVIADSVTVDLEYNTNTFTWELFTLINDTGSGNNGDHGLASLRALIDNIDFGTNGDAVTLASGIGAITTPHPVTQTGGGTIDILYGQDTFNAPSVIGGVGSSRSLIMSGTFASAGTPPAFGDDDVGAITDGSFLDAAVPGPFGPSPAWDSAILNVLDITNVTLPGDFNASGTVDSADYTTWSDNLGSNTPLPNDDGLGAPIGQGHYDLWKDNFQTGQGAVSSGSVAVPEPTAILLLLVGVTIASIGRRTFAEGHHLMEFVWVAVFSGHLF